jgi:D-alanine transaminase
MSQNTSGIPRNIAMTSIPSLAFLNGQFLPMAEARISVLDRGFLFADGIYEVVAVVRGVLVDCPGHLARLQRSLREIRITPPISLDELPTLMRELIAREQLDEGLVYLQCTRGAHPQRAFHFPDPAQTTPTFVMFAQRGQLLHNPLAETGVKVITLPDIRWRRRDIKSTALLASVLGKQAATEAGAFEAWMVEDGYVTEGTSSTACIITADDVLITRPLSQDVLDSITRRAVFRLAREAGLPVSQRAFTPQEAYAAREAFTASATALIMPIVDIDGHRIGDGTPGPRTRWLRQRYLQLACSENPEIAEPS